jgi:hypothetical protein
MTREKKTGTKVSLTVVICFATSHTLEATRFLHNVSGSAPESRCYTAKFVGDYRYCKLGEIERLREILGPIFWTHRWPDNERYEKEKCLKEVARVIDEGFCDLDQVSTETKERHATITIHGQSSLYTKPRHVRSRGMSLNGKCCALLRLVSENK